MMSAVIIKFESLFLLTIIVQHLQYGWIYLGAW